MTDIIKAMNPTAPVNTEAAALAAARVSAVGIAIGAIHQAFNAWYATTPEASAAAAASAADLIEKLTGQVPSAEQLAASAQQGMMVAGVLTLLQIGLAVWQWLKPNIVLPILFLVLCVWTFGTSALGLAPGGHQPMYLSLFSLFAMGIAIVTHIAGIRGASALGKIRQQAETAQDD
ncbi:hypothetical protein [Brevundimonas sp. FT23028]|uniref:hypothetical protein n=1 Tax=Brevundimonas sp. FT23028 TaxID=3393748 RepID=UPI003B58644B